MLPADKWGQTRINKFGSDPIYLFSLVHVLAAVDRQSRAGNKA
jgi:hypothetical protein